MSAAEHPELPPGDLCENCGERPRRTGYRCFSLRQVDPKGLLCKDCGREARDAQIGKHPKHPVEPAALPPRHRQCRTTPPPEGEEPAPCEWCGAGGSRPMHTKQPCRQRSGLTDSGGLSGRDLSCWRPTGHGGFHVACVPSCHDLIRWQVENQAWPGSGLAEPDNRELLESIFGPVTRPPTETEGSGP